MQDRHLKREIYFKEQGIVTERYVMPYINRFYPITSDLVIAEIGCGEAGNLRPFLEIGCKVIGIDIAKNKIENAKLFYANHPLLNNLTLIAENICNISPERIGKFDLVIMRDTLEHIPNQDKFLSHIWKFLKPDGKIFFGFPPWRMPFGGHQQICENKFLSKVPYFHLFPKILYVWTLKLFGESQAKINGLIGIRNTRIGIQRFRKIVLKNNFKIEREDFYLINPNYEVKFKLKVCKLPKLINIPYLRDFYTTTCYYILTK